VPVAVGDWDGDGAPDVVVASLQARPQCLVVYNGKTGSELLRLPGSEGCYFEAFACEDIERDGRCEIAAAKSRTIWSVLDPKDRARVLVYGHKPGALLATVVDNEHRLDYEGCLFVSDMDGDGKDDLLVLQYDDCTNADRAAKPPAGVGHKDASGLLVYSTRTGSVLCTLMAAQGLRSSCDGIHFARLSDLDRDGSDEIGVGFDCDMVGYARIYSGRTGSLLRTHEYETSAEGICNLTSSGHYAVSMVGLGDADGDGVNDYAIGTSGGVDGLGYGCVSIYSGKSGKLLRVIRKRDLVGK
jgi:hypothetical protein